MDLSGAPESPVHRVGLRAGVVGDSFVGEREDTPVSLDSQAICPLAIGVCYQAQEENGDQLLRRNHGRCECSLSAAALLTVLNINNNESENSHFSSELNLEISTNSGGIPIPTLRKGNHRVAGV